MDFLVLSIGYDSYTHHAEPVHRAYLGISSIFRKMEAIYSSKTLVTTYKTTHHHNPEYYDQNSLYPELNIL
jgi:hypothetical protein